MVLYLNHCTWHYPRTPAVMGIVNVNDDSFSGDGTLDVGEALRQARRMVSEGASIIDVGAESARTNRAPISVTEEVDRLGRFIDGYDCDAVLSINTWRPDVVRQVLPMGGDLLNDIGALPTPENAILCAKHGTALLIMHSIGLPKVAHTTEAYESVMDTLERFFEEKIALCTSVGLDANSIILDPGIDFAKQREDNLTIYRELSQLCMFGRPILLPVSRKTVIGDVLGLEAPADRDAGTVACITAGMQTGASIFRVHNVRAAVDTVRLLTAISRPEGRNE